MQLLSLSCGRVQANRAWQWQEISPGLEFLSLENRVSRHNVDLIHIFVAVMWTKTLVAIYYRDTRRVFGADAPMIPRDVSFVGEIFGWGLNLSQLEWKPIS